MHRIMRTLHEDHINVAGLLDLMEVVFAEIQTGGQARTDVLYSTMRYMTAYPDLYHHPAEDIVFQRLISRAPEIIPKVKQLTEEHQLIGAAGTNLRQYLKKSIELESDPTQNLISFGLDYVARLRAHMNTEESEVFPLAKVILSDNDWQILDEKIVATSDPLFGPQLQKSYQDLARVLTDTTKR